MEKITNNKGVEINLQKKREKIRRKLRDKGVLPKIGDPLNESQTKIMDQISNNDFSFYEQYKINQHMETKTYKLKLYNEIERPLIKKTKIMCECGKEYKHRQSLFNHKKK
jgi:hypothetical protein